MERQLSAIELLMKGYDKTEKDHLEEAQEVEVAVKKDNVKERELTAIEKLMNGYNPDSSQKEKEVKVNPNDIKDKEEKE